MIQQATIGGGCFWCTEAIFQQVKGIDKIVSGYSGGTVPGKPTYREVCSGLTGHAEVIQLTFDSTMISYHEILTIFMATHNPTTLNKQGADRGTQYRSVIFYHTEKQKDIASKLLNELQDFYDSPIVTELSSYTNFFEAELEHQNYYNQHTEQAYCDFVISPKLAKFRASFKKYLK